MPSDVSNLPILLLTRPASANARVLADCEAQFGRDIPVVTSPILEIQPIGDCPDLAGYTSVILTSAHAVRCKMNGIAAYCVGQRTADAAQAAGATVMHIAADATELLARCKNVPAPAIYLRGAHVSGDLAAAYGCDEQVVYDQISQPLSEEACHVLGENHPVILPLFSPRSARLVAQQVSGTFGQLHLIAMSPAVAAAWQGEIGAAGVAVTLEICDAPTQVMMVSRIVASLRAT